MDWDEVVERVDHMHPQLYGYYLGLVEGWAWEHPNDQPTSDHVLPVQRDGNLSPFLPVGSTFDPLDFAATVRYLDDEASIWWWEFFIRGDFLICRIATTENDAAFPSHFNNRPPLDINELNNVWDNYQKGR